MNRFKTFDARVQAYNESLLRKADQRAVQQRLPHIMGVNELLVRVSMLARASPLDLMDDNGNIDVKKVKQAGLQYLISGVKRRVTKYPNGTVTETFEYKVESRAKYLELLGRTMDLWKQDDPDAMARWLLQGEAEARAQLEAVNGEPEGEIECNYPTID